MQPVKRNAVFTVTNPQRGCAVGQTVKITAVVVYYYSWAKGPSVEVNYQNLATGHSFVGYSLDSFERMVR